MTIISLTENRKDLVNAITSVTNQKMHYQGPPTFAFTDGTFTVNREGNLEVNDLAANVDVLKELAAQKLIDNSWDEDRDILSISMPMEGHSVESLIRLLQIIWSKEDLINKAVGTKAGFRISTDFLSSIKEEPLTSISEFLLFWQKAGGKLTTIGISFDKEAVSFTGFPYTEDASWIKAYSDLAAAIGKEAKTAKRVKAAKADAENEKYYFRVWLVRLGFEGEAFKDSRKKLLSNLSGNCAFRTQEQKEIHLLKYRRNKD